MMQTFVRRLFNRFLEALDVHLSLVDPYLDHLLEQHFVVFDDFITAL